MLVRSCETGLLAIWSTHVITIERKGLSGNPKIMEKIANHIIPFNIKRHGAIFIFNWRNGLLHYDYWISKKWSGKKPTKVQNPYTNLRVLDVGLDVETLKCIDTIWYPLKFENLIYVSYNFYMASSPVIVITETEREI